MISLLGHVVGNYRLEMTIGTGALGETYRATDLHRGGLAAVKVLHAALTAEPSFDERFRREVARAAGVRHPNLLEILDYGADRGRWFIAMACVEGGSLRTLLHRRTSQLPLRRAVELGAQAAAGLGALHARGLLHGDVKPENLLVEPPPPARIGEPGRLLLADSGLTRLAESGLTIAGTLSVGSLPYLSPEHVRGLALDPRSDLYALGIVLYEAVTGYPPFQVTTLGEALAKHTGATPPPPSSVTRDLPAGVERLVLRCLAKDPTDRFQSAADLEAALLGELAGIAPPALVVMREPVSASAPAVPADGPIIVLREPGAPAAAPAQAPSPSLSAPRRFRVALDGVGGAVPPASRALVPPSPPAEPPPVVRFQRHEEPNGPTLPEGPLPRTSRPAARADDSRRVRVALDRDVLALVPGQQGFVTVTIVNAGRTVDHFRIEVDGVPAAWVRTPVQPLQLNPGQRATVSVGIPVPRAPESTAGTYPVIVRARSRENPDDSGGAGATWTVLPFVQASLALEPARRRAWRRARFTASLRNDGNVPARFAVAASDEERTLRWALPRQEVRLDPGAAVPLALDTRARLRPFGSAETRVFTVRGELVEAPPEAPVGPAPVASGQLVHRAVLPLWVPPLLLVVVLALAFFFRGAGDVQLAVTPAALQVPVGARAPLVAALTNRRNETVAGRAVAWRSRDTTVAAVSDSGVVEARREGTTVVTASAGRVSAAVQVAVVAAQVERLTVTPKRLRLDVGGAAVLRAVPTDGAGAVLQRDVTWQSSDPTVVTVGGNGRVTAKAGGAATITAQVDQRSATTDVTVNAPKPEPVAAGAAAPAADCVAYEPGTLRVARAGAAGWAVGDGRTALLTLDTRGDAERALALAQRWRSHCFLGRTNTRPNRSDYVVEYWDGPTGVPTVIPDERCVGYDRQSLRIVDRREQGFELAAGGRRLLLADTRQDAQRAWETAQRGVALCAIGRDNRRPNQRDYVVQYWR